MSTSTTSLRRVVIFLSGVALGLSLLTGVASATPSHDPGPGQSAHSGSNLDNQSPQPASNADYTGNGANQHGAYDSTRDGSPSENGNGNGNATGKPCAGCVGKADNKNPKGQAPDGSDRNNGYECDGNQGVGKTNPAHTGCTATPGTTGDGSTPPAVSGSDDGSSGGTGPQGSTGGVTDSPSPPAGPSSGAPGDLANKPTCAGGTMPSDATGDGAASSTGCSAVEGVTLTRAASSVLGTTLVHDPAPAGSHGVVALAAGTARGITTLASTGFDSVNLVGIALILLAIGAALLRRANAMRRP